MFKKKCDKCKKKISKNYEFCPYCGYSSDSKEDYGLLGKNDELENDIFPSFFENSMMDKMFNSAMKMAEKIMEKQLKDFPEFNKQLKENNPHKKIQPQITQDNNLEVQFFVNGKRVFPPNQNQEQSMPEIRTVKINPISRQKIEKFAKFPKKEPSSKLRRLSGKIIYEFEVPDVKNIEDVLINQLENSIEIKALGKDKVYSKTLNINLPILGYKLEQGNLILELKA